MAIETAIIVLAAGQSARMGTPKQLLPLGDTNLLNHCLRRATQVSATHLLLVLGAQADTIRSQLEDVPVAVVVHKEWATGMGGSISVGLQRALQLQPDLEQVVITLGDLPLIERGHYQKLLEKAQANSQSIVATRYPSTHGVPVLFKKKHFSDLLALQGDLGARKLLSKHRDQLLWVDTELPYTDIDTPEDYQHILRTLDLS